MDSNTDLLSVADVLWWSAASLVDQDDIHLSPPLRSTSWQPLLCLRVPMMLEPGLEALSNQAHSER